SLGVVITYRRSGVPAAGTVVVTRLRVGYPPALGVLMPCRSTGDPAPAGVVMADHRPSDPAAVAPVSGVGGRLRLAVGAIIALRGRRPPVPVRVMVAGSLRISAGRHPVAVPVVIAGRITLHPVAVAVVIALRRLRVGCADVPHAVLVVVAVGVRAVLYLVVRDAGRSA